MRRSQMTFPLLLTLILLGTWILGSSGDVSAASPTTGASGVTAQARNYLDRLTGSGRFRGAVLVERNGTVLLNAGYGLADLATGAPAQATTRFRIGSLTKAFTAMAILQLVDAGRLTLTDRLCQFVAGCPPAWHAITLAELLTHTSGIPDYTSLPGYAARSGEHLTPNQLIALVARRPLMFTPGSRWSYSNTGYYLLGLVIERVSGISYAQFLTRHIFAPLQMHHTGYDVNHPAPPAHAVGYVNGSRPARYIDMSVPFAAGALYSTTSDLARWDTALLTGRPALLRRSTLQQMFSPAASISLGHPDAGAYGYGWFIDLRGAEYDHDGLINGFATYNSIFPRRRIAIIVLSNLQSSDVRTIDDHLAALLGQQAR
jgi:D-alanyl-D-alanine carboxypeptidase